MLHHASLAVSDLVRAAAFYDPALAALGYVRVWTFPDGVGYGTPGGEDQLALKADPGRRAGPDPRTHLALLAPHRPAVDAFHAAAVACGGTDDGPPGPRPHYGPHYYAAFVVDPDGHRIEAVVSTPVGGQGPP